VSIMAEIIAAGAATAPFGNSETGTGAGPAAVRGPAEAIDPVCGMSVAVTESVIQLETQEGKVCFCCPSCRDAFAADPGRYTRTL
jgi:xanthine dehydrogenase accessory factor